jgi:hypothetical protein
MGCPPMSIEMTNATMVIIWFESKKKKGRKEKKSGGKYI